MTLHWDDADSLTEEGFTLPVNLGNFCLVYKILTRENEKIRPGKCPQLLVQDTSDSSFFTTVKLES